jgi:DNA-binding Lrp family transcriptional regulator
VSARIARLERNGVIAGYGLRLGANNRPALEAIVGIKLAPRSAAAIASALAELPEVESLHALSGEFDMLARLHFSAPSELEDWLAKVGAMDGITELRTSIVLSTKLDRRSIG